MHEDEVQALVRVRAGEMGILIQRNNNGAMEDKSGRIVRYGLMNDSAQLNRRVKSSDLIGLVPRVIPISTAGFAGQTETLGQYLAAECKHSEWKLTAGDERGQAQLRYIKLVRQHGGLAGFVRSVEEFERLVRGETLEW